MSWGNSAVCAECGIEFVIQYNGQVCCTEMCKDEYDRKENIRKNADLEKYSNCKQCGDKFERNSKTYPFCSQKCKYISEGHIGECRNCKKKFIKRDKDDIFCSVGCEDIFKVKTNKLEKIIGKTGISITVDTVTKYDKAKLEKDLETCLQEYVINIDTISKTKFKNQKLLQQKEYLETVLKLKNMVEESDVQR